AFEEHCRLGWAQGRNPTIVMHGLRDAITKSTVALRSSPMGTLATFDPKDLEAKVKAMYRKVAEDPHGEFHFEMGRAMAERLGYAPADLDRIPAEAIESFAGVGYYFDLAALKEGETVLDLGSGSGMDTLVAALKVGKKGRVIGIDMTDAQLDKAERLRA